MNDARRTRPLLAALAVSVVALLATSTGASAAAPVESHAGTTTTTTTTTTGSTTTTSYLLALGDSLAAGYQPVDGRTPPSVNPATGYADGGYPGGYAADLASQRHLTLVDLACPGETTASMTGSPAEGQCTKVYKAELGASSQLAAAKAFLARHVGAVSLITIDLGANNIDGCVSARTFNVACLNAGQNTVKRQLPAIVASLRSVLATDDPGARLVGMNYYDPFLGIAYAPGGFAGTAGAALSLPAVRAFNGMLATIYHRQAVPVADVATAFSTGAVLPVRSYARHRLPLNVDLVCRWTWMCPLPGSSAKADIHADTVGYRVIASAFTKVLAQS
ncbi:MAG: hypothetical protein JWO62_1502 [Acidimicrobiaceae bacterium]|nr:hypothetical protein [Acidimicrobiaceae bacterium]